MTASTLGVAVAGPLVAYAGISVVYPSSQHVVNLDAAPPITITTGSDYTQANSIGWLSSASAENNSASLKITISLLSGGNYTIDKYANVTKESSVASYKFQVASALSGTLTGPNQLKLRFWAGATAPTKDTDSQVCAVLDLESSAGTQTTGSCPHSRWVQLVTDMPIATGSSSVTIRPSSITFA